MKFNFLQIRSKSRGEVVWNAIPMGFLQMRLKYGHPVCSNQISECPLSHFMDVVHLNGMSWWTRPDARWPQSLTNDLRHILKFAHHLSSSNVSSQTCSHQSLLCGWHQTSRCTVKPAVTAARNIIMFIGLFCTWVCLVRWSSAPRLDSACVWIARWCISIFPFVVLPCCKAASPVHVLTPTSLLR